MENSKGDNEFLPRLIEKLILKIRERSSEFESLSVLNVTLLAGLQFKTRNKKNNIAGKLNVRKSRCIEIWIY